MPVTRDKLIHDLQTASEYLTTAPEFVENLLMPIIDGYVAAKVPKDGSVVDVGGQKMCLSLLEIALSRLREHGEVHIVNVDVDVNRTEPFLMFFGAVLAEMARETVKRDA